MEELQRQAGDSDAEICFSKRKSTPTPGLEEQLKEMPPELRSQALPVGDQIRASQAEGAKTVGRRDAESQLEPWRRQLLWETGPPKPERGKECPFLSLPPTIQSPVSASHWPNLGITVCRASLCAASQAGTGSESEEANEPQGHPPTPTWTAMLPGPAHTPKFS